MNAQQQDINHIKQALKLPITNREVSKRLTGQTQAIAIIEEENSSYSSENNSEVGAEDSVSMNSGSIEEVAKSGSHQE